MVMYKLSIKHTIKTKVKKAEVALVKILFIANEHLTLWLNRKLKITESYIPQYIAKQE